MRVRAHAHVAWLAHQHAAMVRSGPPAPAPELVRILEPVKAHLAWLGQRAAGLRSLLNAPLPVTPVPAATAAQAEAILAALHLLAAPPDHGPLLGALDQVGGLLQRVLDRPAPVWPELPAPPDLAPLETGLAALQAQRATDHAAVLAVIASLDATMAGLERRLETYQARVSEQTGRYETALMTALRALGEAAARAQGETLDRLAALEWQQRQDAAAHRASLAALESGQEALQRLVGADPGPDPLQVALQEELGRLRALLTAARAPWWRRWWRRWWRTIRRWIGHG